MIDNAQLLSASQWAHATFAEARLGDQRRTMSGSSHFAIFTSR
jgi:hypothetical protein